MKKIQNILLYVVNYNKNKFKNKLLLSLPDFNSILLVDIGAAGEIDPRWKSIDKNLKYIGFEPDERSNLLLINKYHCLKEYIVHPYAISNINSTDIEINICKKEMVSSVLSPNLQFLNRFPDKNRFDIIKKIKVKSKKIDDFNFINPDFIKLDIQGGELDALKSAEDSLGDVFGLEIEVEFTKIYVNQPLFGEISNYCQEKNFEFIDFVSLCRWERDSINSYGQCVFGDALFLKMPEYVLSKEISDERLSSYLGILMLYKRFDLIDKVYEIISPARQKSYSLFFEKLKKLKKSHNKIRIINNIVSKITRIMESECKTHLFY